jgi:diketogulonate reductase-like aldo/keto reductase
MDELYQLFPFSGYKVNRIRIEEDVNSPVRVFLDRDESKPFQCHEYGLVGRSQLFLQTKFTYQRGQDYRLPYNPKSSFREQVLSSFASSLEHLGTEHLDSYLLHGPYTGKGLVDADIEVWRTMEEMHRSAKVTYLGVSNVSYEQLKALLSAVTIKPKFVQNRCFAELLWDNDIRSLCREHQVVYQGFSLLTANTKELNKPALRELATKYNATMGQLVFRFAQQVGILPLTGTTDPTHMAEDLACDKFDISEIDLRLILTGHS